MPRSRHPYLRRAQRRLGLTAVLVGGLLTVAPAAAGVAPRDVRTPMPSSADAKRPREAAH